MSRPSADIKVGDRLCFFRKIVPENEETTVLLVVTDIQVEYKACAFQGATQNYCPCSAVCNAFDGKVILQQENSSEKGSQRAVGIRELLTQIRDKRIWHVDSQELFDHAGIHVQPGGAQ
jgi:hypothetical protein